jgi:hypothetical protein
VPCIPCAAIYTGVSPSGDVPKHGESGELNVNTQSLNDVNKGINALLANPSVSNWLRNALTTALERDPVDAANDADILYVFLSARLNAVLAIEEYNNDVDQQQDYINRFERNC